MKKKISITINEKTLKEIDSIIDNIYIRNRSQAIEFLVNSSLGENRTAAILAGGSEEDLKIGREYRMTAKISSSSVIEMAIKKLKENGFKTIFFIARHNVMSRAFDLVGDGSLYGMKITYLEEKESDGTADSLRLLRGKIKNNFLVVYSDIIFDKINIEELWNDHLRHRSIATLMLTTSPTPSKKGVVRMEGEKILEFVQKPKQSDIYIGFSSIFAAEPEIMEYGGASLEKDVFPVLAQKGLLQGHLSSQKETHIHTKKDILDFCKS